MQRAVERISRLCILAAVCGQLMKESRYSGMIRMALGLEISLMVFSILEVFVRGVCEWS